MRSTYTFSVRINLSLDIQLSNLMMSYDEPLTISAGCRDYIELSKTPENYQGQEFLISWNSQELLRCLKTRANCPEFRLMLSDCQSKAGSCVKGNRECVWATGLQDTERPISGCWELLSGRQRGLQGLSGLSRELPGLCSVHFVWQRQALARLGDTSCRYAGPPPSPSKVNNFYQNP